MDIEKIKEQMAKKEAQIQKTEERLKKYREQLKELEQQVEVIKVNSLLQTIKEKGLNIEEAASLIEGLGKDSNKGES
ncbi:MULTISPECIES: hypothetical protein [Enterococcus]|uniref:DUF4315 family protein n=1 Tax=Enterococcus lemanii TaxID=1159752 RepID=A0ABV9MVZ4_9ENTE|nr:MULTISPECIES: hypothetical protein [Enterococcus]MCU1842139.1 hypothetical protein [Enterococcus faecium]MBM7708836.1 putative nucleic acid-binding Zn-ribbon protein [Enterococcus lemanii]MBP7085798.1 hypothetical protein [Enterococcus sp.]MBP8693606.1 hypothetical protein [Enterococcus sp.]MBP8751092.1 hypothetical protein [Enterococcus sp.]